MRLARQCVKLEIFFNFHESLGVRQANRKKQDETGHPVPKQVEYESGRGVKISFGCKDLQNTNSFRLGISASYFSSSGLLLILHIEEMENYLKLNNPNDH